MAGNGATSFMRAVPLRPITVTNPAALPPRLIPSSIAVPGNSSTFNLADEQKRWLVVGICLNKVLLPALRDFIKPVMIKHYTDLKTNHNIDKQTHSMYLRKDKSYQFNYGSINNNEANHRKKLHLYDYKVNSEIDLAKLYLVPYMAKFSGIDDTCDLSAVLGILSSASVFSPGVQSSSNVVKKDVRNEWGHCNFVDWSKLKFLKCFQQMDSLVRNLKLSTVEEKRITDELADWETKGVQMCVGNTVDAGLMTFVQQDVAQLLGEVRCLESSQEKDVQQITEALKIVQEAIEEYQKVTTKKLELMKQSQESTSQKVEELGDVAAAIADDVNSLKTSQTKLKTDVVFVKEKEEKLARRIEYGEKRIDNLDQRVEALESAIERSSSNRTFNTFQAPNRIPCFHGRVEELLILAKPLKTNTSTCNVSTVCGLGGTGKTSLAIEHIWKNKEVYTGGVFWISGESNNLFNLSLCEMSRQIGTFDENFKTTLSKTLDWLHSRKDYWCLVVDNLDELNLSTDMLKLVGGHWKPHGTGHILITTRREKKHLKEEISDLAEENCIELRNLTETESVEFMKMRTERVVDETEDVVIGELVEELGCLPLALDQAASYIKIRTAISFSQYLEQYREQKLNVLKRSKAYYPVQDTSKDRIAVNTTWELNFDYVSRLSVEYGMGQAAALVMEISAFLSPNDIPNEIINKGLPEVNNKDLLNCLSTSLGLTDILSVLTKFSLFQLFTDNSFSVHRLVQEVIRDKIRDEGRLKDVLQSASRMLYHAFANNRSPVEVCKNFQGDSVFNQDNPPSLYLWGKFGAHASVLQSHLIQNSQQSDMIRQELLYSEESVMLLNEVSVYLSVCRQTKEAMESKELKLKILTHLNMPEEKIDRLTFLDIPLKDVQFKLISHCMARIEPLAHVDKNESERNREKADQFRKKGNEAFKMQKYKEAAEFYTAAIERLKDDPRLYNNRALCELKLGNAEEALRNCEISLNLEERNKKALMRKAWALYELLKTQGDKLKGRMRATAALAAYVDPTLLTNDKLFKKMFPSITFEEIVNSSELAASFMYSVPGKTYLLHEGCYELHEAMLDTDIQLVATSSQWVTLKFVKLGVFQSSLYVEGVVFAKGSGGIVCYQKGSLDFFNCRISGGFNCCHDYPDCNGGPGCIAAKFAGMKTCDRTGKFGIPFVSGMVGTPSIRVMLESSCILENCDITECGGVAIICQDDGSILRVVSCRVHNNPQSGLEVDGGRLIAIDNEIYANGFHGVLITKSSGPCQISKNRIYENKKDAVSVNLTDQEVTINNNRIYHNFGMGIDLMNCGQVEVTQNEIFENSYYGIGAMLSTTATIEKNDIYSNKCGGIYIGRNYSGRIVIESNTIRDHNGSWLVNNVPIPLSQDDAPRVATKEYSIPPIVVDNDLKNNEETRFHPKKKIESVQTECAFCRQSKNLSRCFRCNIASYCNKVCQERHWSRHKALCSALSDQYSVTIEPKRILDHSPKLSQPEVCVEVMTFGSHLKDIGKGPEPNPKSNRRFIVKIQTGNHNCHPLQNLTVYDKSLYIYGEFQSREIFNVIMECGVLGKLNHFTSKKAFFYATFADGGKKLNIYLGQLAPYQDW